MKNFKLIILILAVFPSLLLCKPSESGEEEDSSEETTPSSPSKLTSGEEEDSSEETTHSSMTEETEDEEEPWIKSVTKVEWVHRSQVNISWLEPAGKERSERNGDITLYVARGRGRYGRSYMPGKYNDAFDRAYTSFSGEAIDIEDYEFLVAPPGALSWVPGSGKQVPENMIYGGTHPLTMERLHVCRGLDSKYLITGWYSFHEGTCSTSYDESELKTDKFEVLVLNAYGRAINAGMGDSEATWNYAGRAHPK